MVLAITAVLRLGPLGGRVLVRRTNVGTRLWVLRVEAPLVNARVRKMVRHFGLKVGVVGPAADLTFEYDHIGDSAAALSQLKAGEGFGAVLGAAPAAGRRRRVRPLARVRVGPAPREGAVLLEGGGAQPPVEALEGEAALRGGVEERVGLGMQPRPRCATWSYIRWSSPCMRACACPCGIDAFSVGSEVPSRSGGFLRGPGAIAPQGRDQGSDVRPGSGQDEKTTNNSS